MNDLQTQNFSQQANNDLAVIEQSKEIARIQAQYVIAKKFPRDESLALQKIIKQCQRKTLAEVAMYSFPKGGTNVTGPSIRLAESLACSFGNITFGVRIISQDAEKVEAQAFCIDLETNTEKSDTFTVRLEIYTKKHGIKKLTDPREILEHVKSQGSRMVRSCVMAIIPGDIVEAAIEQCERTLNSDEDPIDVKIQKLITAFVTYNVTIEMLERRVGKNIKALNNADILALRKVYQSLKDGMAGIEDYFDVAPKQKPVVDASKLPDIKPQFVATDATDKTTSSTINTPLSDEEKAEIEKKEREEQIDMFGGEDGK